MCGLFDGNVGFVGEVMKTIRLVIKVSMILAFVFLIMYNGHKSVK